MTHLRRRFWIEATTTVVCIVLVAITLAWPDWLELGFGVDPDHGSGAVEWLIVGLAAALAMGCSALASFEWRRASSVTG